MKIISYRLLVYLVLISVISQGCSTFTYYPSEGIKQVKKSGSISECSVPVYFPGNVPDTPYEVIGICKTKSILTGGQSTEKSMEQLEKCACKYGGDAGIYRTSELLKYNNYDQIGQYHGGAKASGIAIKFIK